MSDEPEIRRLGTCRSPAELTAAVRKRLEDGRHVRLELDMGLTGPSSIAVSASHDHELLYKASAADGETLRVHLKTLLPVLMALAV